MIDAILTALGRSPLRNRSGSNLMRGVASALIESASLSGNLPAGVERGLFEVDEAAMPGVVSAVQPRTLVLLNLFRDQLDRYGEVATIGRIWKGAIARLPETTRIVANADDPLIVDVVSAARTPVLYFGIESTAAGRTETEHAGDVKSCPRCGATMSFSAVFLGHQGHFRCTRCSLVRPTLRCKRSMCGSRDSTEAGSL